MKMRKNHICAVVAIAAIAFVGFFLLPLFAAWFITLFPVTTDSAASLVRMTALNHVAPGLTVGIVLGCAAALFSPVRHLAVLMLPAILVFLAYLFMNLMQFPVEWSARFLLTFFIPEWSALFIGAAGAAAVTRKLRVSNQQIQPIAEKLDSG